MDVQSAAEFLPSGMRGLGQEAGTGVLTGQKPEDVGRIGRRALTIQSVECMNHFTRVWTPNGILVIPLR
jgi:hypothetical protein